MSQTRPYDIIIYGATGFTGEQAAGYLARHVKRTGNTPPLKLAIAGRNAGRLEQVQHKFKAMGVELGVVVADSGQPDTIHAMARAARVVLTTVGPYALYGTPVVEACVEAGTDYVDITGETPWVRDMIDRHHARAAAQGTKIIPFCGFDSVPSDLGTWMVVQHLRQQHGQDTRQVHAWFQAAGGFNGGTLASLLNLFDSGRQADVLDPLLLNPAEHLTPELAARNPDLRAPVKVKALGRWGAPFFMAPVNTRVVRRSHALATMAGQGYGPAFSYQEGLLVGKRLGRAQALAVTGVMGATAPTMSLKPARELLRRLGPDPGQGPDAETMDRGFFRCTLLGIGEDGREVRGCVEAQGDPGNRNTVRMLCEAALCLTLQRDALPGGPQRGGILTPATAFGDILLDRLRAAGMTWDVC